LIFSVLAAVCPPPGHVGCEEIERRQGLTVPQRDAMCPRLQILKPQNSCLQSDLIDLVRTGSEE
jgi:hypothetical protein